MSSRIHVFVVVLLVFLGNCWTVDALPLPPSSLVSVLPILVMDWLNSCSYWIPPPRWGGVTPPPLPPLIGATICLSVPGSGACG